MRRKVNIKQFGKEMQGLPDELERAVVKGLQSTAMRGVSVVVGEIEKAKAVDSAALKQSVGYKKVADGADIKVDAPHAPFVEYGTRPHWPPLEPLILWATRKLGLSEKDAESAARAIQVKISKKGTPPKKFMAKAMRQITSKVLPVEIEREVNKL